MPFGGRGFPGGMNPQMGQMGHMGQNRPGMQRPMGP